MRKDKEFIFRLRWEGKSFRDIQSATGVSRGTLCRWFQSEEWSRHVTTQHNSRVSENAKSRMIKMNMVRKLKLQYQYALVQKEAEKEYKTYKKDPLFFAGVMLYVGSGDKKAKNLIKFSNKDPFSHKLFVQFCLKYLEIKGETIRCVLTVYSSQDSIEAINLWSKALVLPTEQFYKPHILKGSSQKEGLQFGGAATIISNTALKAKLLRWIQLAREEQYNTAVMV